MTGKIEIDTKLLRKIAKLARLQLTEAEESLYVQDLQKILNYVEQLNELDTKGVEPIVHGFPLEEHFREDISIQLPEVETKQYVACSDEPLYDQYRVPQVIGGES